MSNYLAKKSGYPKGVWSVFTTQALLNFAFYGLKAQFILYSVHVRILAEGEAIFLFASLMSLSYAVSLFGGFVADKIMGPGPTVIAGGILAMTGILVLMLFSDSNAFYASLALISLGSGCFKPNISSSLSLMFSDSSDPQRERSFTGLYMAMNLGALGGPVLSGIVANMFGLSAGIGISIAGFMVASVVFALNVHSPHKQHGYLLLKISRGILLLGFAVILLWFLFRYPQLLGGMVGLTLAIVAGLVGIIYYRSNKMERENLLRLAPFMILFTFFCALYEQSGSSVVLFMERCVDRHVWGYEIPASSLLSLNPVFVLLFGSIISFMEKRYGFGKSIHSFEKFSTGFLLISCSFFILFLVLSGFDGSVGLFWIMLFFMCQALGELLIIPVGYSCVSRYAPIPYISVFMSIWMMSIACGHYMAGLLAYFSVTSNSLVSSDGSSFFGILSLISLIGFIPVPYRFLRSCKLFKTWTRDK